MIDTPLKRSVRIACVISDIHCGSEVGLAPPITHTEAGNVIGFGKNLHQAWLWHHWVEGITRVKAICGGDDAILIVNGDATEGVHHRNEASLVAAAIETHVNMAIECLHPFKEFCSKIAVVKGTECHTKNMENLLAEKLGALELKAKDKWLLRIHGCLVDAAHHMGTTSRAYLEASLMSIQMGNARLNYLRAGHEVPKVYLRAHRHCGGHFSDGQGLFAVTGAFQMLSRHGFKVVTDSIPRPSMLVLDWRNKSLGELPQVHDITFNPPPHETTDV